MTIYSIPKHSAILTEWDLPNLFLCGHLSNSYIARFNLSKLHDKKGFEMKLPTRNIRANTII